MARLDRDDLKHRIREANDVVEVIGSFVALKRAGKSYKALCPFHDEKTPSFHVNPERQTFKCFGCGVGGDVFTFVEMHERVDFKEAMAMLAERAGIEMTRSRVPPEEAERARQRKLWLYRIQETAAKLFGQCLSSSDGAAARDYLENRGLGELVEAYSLGYAPPGWDFISSKLGTSPARERLLVAAGLAKERDASGGIYDVFRDRVMFPITDSSGRIVGFGGRILGEGEPKYLNSPETAIFEKGRLLYGLDKAKDEISKEGRAVLVEGYTDVLQCHSDGFTNVVATLGTAIGPGHMRLLRRFGAEKVALVYDADEAGLRAAERGAQILFEEDMPGDVVCLPEGLDPCDLLVERGRDAFAEFLKSAEDAFEFTVRRALEGRDLSDKDETAAAARRLMEVVSKSKDPTRRHHMTHLVSERLGVPEGVLGRLIQERGRGRGGPRPEEIIRSGRRPEELLVQAERELAELLVRCPGALESAKAASDLSLVGDDDVRNLMEALAEILQESGGLFDEKAFLERLTEGAKRMAIDALETREKTSPERLSERARKAAIALGIQQALVKKRALEERIKVLDGWTEEKKGLLAESRRLELEIRRSRSRSDAEARRRLAGKGR